MDAAANPGMAQVIFSYAPIILIFLVFYFLILRPQSQAAKAHAALLAGLAKGDAVLTTGGLLGRIEKVDEGLLTLKVNNEDHMLVVRAAVERKLSDAEAKVLAGVLKK
jgi:preprotein translocase subunit YajC